MGSLLESTENCRREFSSRTSFCVGAEIMPLGDSGRQFLSNARYLNLCCSISGVLNRTRYRMGSLLDMGEHGKHVVGSLRLTPLSVLGSVAPTSAAILRIGYCQPQRRQPDQDSVDN
jgi:hypothetical protein